MKQVKIGAGQGFYGDIIEPALDLAENTDVQYLCFDTLAELTLAILQKDRQKDPSLGYTKDITNTARTLLPYVHEKGIKLITNAGGLNPEGARREVMRVAKELGISGIKIGVATGDDLFHRLDELERAGVDLSDHGYGPPAGRSAGSAAVRQRLSGRPAHRRGAGARRGRGHHRPHHRYRPVFGAAPCSSSAGRGTTGTSWPKAWCWGT